MIVNDMKNIKLDNNWKIVFGIAAIMLVLYLVWFFRVIIAYALIAVVISFIGDPLMEILKKIRIKNWIMPAWLRAMITLVAFFGVIAGFVMMFAPLIGQEIRLISQINPHDIAEKLQTQVSSMQLVMDSNGAAMNQETLTHYLVAKVQEVMSFSWVSGLFGNFFGVISSLVVGVFAVLFMSFFFLKDGFLFTRIVFTLTPDRHIDKVKNVMEHAHRLLRRFFIGIAIQSLLMSVMVGVSLWILGVQNALLIGLFAGLVNVVPYVGPLLGASFGLLVALTASIHMNMDVDLMTLAVKVLSVFLVAQQIDGFVIQPMVLGSSVKAHPLEIFIVILMAGTIGGVVGMVLAIPVYTILRVIAREFLSEYKVVESLTRPLKEED
jgi:predicted PurR-regulated permease PerM